MESTYLPPRMRHMSSRDSVRKRVLSPELFHSSLLSKVELDSPGGRVFIEILSHRETWPALMAA